MKKVLNWTSNIMLMVLSILVILVLLAKLTKSDTILGFIPLKVLTGSMEPVIKTGDLIIVKDISETHIKEGDIITFKLNSDTLVTHRVVEIYKQNGDISFKTKGDANNVEDDELVIGDDLVGKYIFRIPAFGYLTDLIRQPLGFAVLFVFPIAILLGKEVINLIKT